MAPRSGTPRSSISSKNASGSGSSKNASFDLLPSDLYSSLQFSDSHSKLCQNPRVLSVLSSLMERVVTRNENLGTPSPPSSFRHCERLTVFHGLHAPTISIRSYIQRIFRYAGCSPACFVVAYVYIDRFIQQQPGIPITTLNVHRLLITSVMAAAKVFDDLYYNNAFYAKVGGVSTLEMNRLELEFLFNLDFRLHVTLTTFESYCCYLQQQISLCGGQAVERPPKLVCGFKEGSIQEVPEKQRVPVTCTYGAV